MSVVLAFVACGAWGYSTHEAARGGATWGTVPLTAASQLAGLLLLAPWLLIAGVSPPTGNDIGYGAIAGLGSCVSLALLYDACMRMSPGLAAAVSGVTAAVVPVLHAVATDQTPSALAIASMVPCVAGVAVVAIAWQPPSLEPGRPPMRMFPVYEAALSGATMGVYYVALALVDQPAFAVTESRVVATVLLLVVVARTSGTVGRPHRSVRTVLLVGIPGAAGTIAYGYAVDASTLVPVVAIVSVAPAVTAWLGRWLADERLAVVQLLGLLICVGGAMLAAIAAVSR